MLHSVVLIDKQADEILQDEAHQQFVQFVYTSPRRLGLEKLEKVIIIVVSNLSRRGLAQRKRKKRKKKGRVMTVAGWKDWTGMLLFSCGG